MIQEAPPVGYRTQAADTAYPIERLLVSAWRRMPPWEKAARLVECCQAVEQLSLAGLRLRHPAASDRELHLRAAALRLGRPLVMQVWGWDLSAEAAHGTEAAKADLSAEAAHGTDAAKADPDRPNN